MLSLRLPIKIPSNLEYADPDYIIEFSNTTKIGLYLKEEAKPGNTDYTNTL